MDDARRLWLQNPESGTMVVARYQRRGRGRIPERRWVSAPGESLMATVALSWSVLAESLESSDLPETTVPLRVGGGVAVALRRLGVDAMVKWPNDILVGNRKICGILVETVPDGVLIGVGLNCNQRSFPDTLRRHATSLLLATGRGHRPLDLIDGVFGSIRVWLKLSEWREPLRPLLWNLGAEVSIRTGDSALFGRISGIDQDGALLLQTSGGHRRVVSGHIAEPL